MDLANGGMGDIDRGRHKMFGPGQREATRRASLLETRALLDAKNLIDPCFGAKTWSFPIKTEVTWVLDGSKWARYFTRCFCTILRVGKYRCDVSGCSKFSAGEMSHVGQVLRIPR